jgi:carbamoyltransferase
MNILGISAFYHDSAACLVKNGEIIAAAQEERFTRKKHDPDFPINATNYCLKEGEINSNQLDYVCFYDKPILKFERILLTYLAFAPKGIKSFLMSIPLWLKKKIWMKDLIKNELGYDGEILFTEHHESHAASAFYPSPFTESAILTLDGVGEWATASYGIGKGNDIEIIAEMNFPHSLGLLYSAFTYYTGFKVNSGEYKLMGLSPYGEPNYVNIILNEIVDVKDDGSIRLNMKYFNYCTGLTMTNENFNKLFGNPPRKSETKITQFYCDVASSIQKTTETIIMNMVRHIKKETNLDYLCLAGGVALNCVANGKILKENLFKDIWIQPAAGDAGGAVGSALFVWYKYLDNKREAKNKKDFQKASLLGPSYTEEEIEDFLNKEGVKYSKLPKEEIPKKIAELIVDGKVVGILQGRMEFGPRALGCRSIVGDPRSKQMQSLMNLKIKFRESFRPFAPTVAIEKVNNYFELDHESPYMLLVAPVRKELRNNLSEEEKKLKGIDKLKIHHSIIPAITHVDYSARIQTVSKEDNPFFYNIIKEVEKLTGYAVIINTSFNIRGEPIICSPKDAYTCFMRTHMDFLIMELFILNKEEQKKWIEDFDWKKEYVLD